MLLDELLNEYKICNNCSIGYNSFPDGWRCIHIGNTVDIAGEVKIITLEHDLNDKEYKTKGASVIIKDNASILWEPQFFLAGLLQRSR